MQQNCSSFIGPQEIVAERLPRLSPRCVAAALMLSIPTVYRAMRAGRLRAVKVNGGRIWRTSPAWVAEWLGDGSSVEVVP